MERKTQILVGIILLLAVSIAIYAYQAKQSESTSLVQYSTDGVHWKNLDASMIQRNEAPQRRAIVSFMDREQKYYRSNDTLELNVIVSYEKQVTLKAGNLSVMINDVGDYSIRIPEANISTENDTVSSTTTSDYTDVPIHDMEKEENRLAIEADYQPFRIGSWYKLIEFVEPYSGNPTGVTSFSVGPNNRPSIALDVAPIDSPARVEIFDNDYRYGEDPDRCFILAFDAPGFGSYRVENIQKNMTGRVNVEVHIYNDTARVYSQNFTLKGSEFVKDV
jgi:hypothetical protein